jgi:hypothetical protein
MFLKNAIASSQPERQNRVDRARASAIPSTTLNSQ